MYRYPQVEIRFFCLTCHFWCWNKSPCSSPIATKRFSGAVTLLFCPAFAEAFPISAIKKCLICRKLTFLFLFCSIFYSEYTDLHCHLFPTSLKSKAEQGWHLPKANIPRGYAMLSPTGTLKDIILLIYKFWCWIKKTALVPKISHDLLNLSLKLLHIFSLTFRIEYLRKCSCNKRMQNIYMIVFTCFMILSYRSCYIDWNSHTTIFLTYENAITQY